MKYEWRKHLKHFDRKSVLTGDLNAKLNYVITCSSSNVFFELRLDALTGFSLFI